MAVGAELKKPLKGIALTMIGVIVLVCGVVSADEGLKQRIARNDGSMQNSESGYLTETISLLLRSVETLFQHVWPNMEFGWRTVVGTIIGFFGAALGSVGGVGGGGIFVPMFILIIGFDPKSSTALSKCMIMGAAISTVYYNLKLRHPTRNRPLIDYDAALLLQPMLVLGISIGVCFNVIFTEWMVTVLLIILFVGTSTKAFFKGIETWKKESIIKDAARHLTSNYNGSQVPYERLPDGPTNETRMRVNEFKPSEVSIINNVCWKEFGILFLVWVIILLLHIAKDLTATCSVAYWIVTLLQVPVAVVASGYEAVCLYKGWRVMGSKVEAQNTWTISQLIFCCFCGVLAGIVGGLLGLGGGFILGPLFLELGITPGLKCYSHIHNGIFFIHVRDTVLSLEAISHIICPLFYYGGRYCCIDRATCCAKDDQPTRESIDNHLHFGLHNSCERNIARWSWHIKYHWEGGGTRIYVVLQHMRVCALVLILIISCILVVFWLLLYFFCCTFYMLRFANFYFYFSP